MNKIIKVFVLAFVLSILSASGVYAAGPSAINLGTAGNFVILSKTGISTTGTTSVVGDIGVSPAQATYITWFGLILPAAGAYSTSSLVTGKVYAPSYATPTPANISTAVSDMETAYTDGAGRSLSAITELGAGNIGGMTLAPGLYKWGTGVTIPTDVTLSGSANDVWIFIVAQKLDISSAKSIVLSGGAQASNIFWVVAGQTTIGTGATFNGNILDQTAIVLNTGAVLNGRALAQSAVTLDASRVTISGTASSNTSTNNDSVTTTTTSNTNSNNDTVSNIPSANSIPNTIEPGCSNSNVYNTSTGALCVNNAVPQGCSGGNIYSTSTGAICVNNVITQIPGCGNSATGFSTATGLSCVGNVSNANKNSYNFGTVTLKNGSTGNAVMELQRFLNTKLNLGLVIDGKLGPKTIAIIKKWQTANGLVSDGLVGAKTKIMMNL
jgi:hypothetical protein